LRLHLLKRAHTQPGIRQKFVLTVSTPGVTINGVTFDENGKVVIHGNLTVGGNLTMVGFGDS
jgi:uncharacterized Zn-binding protein involved in type VI secretion